jgi:hypothetical protein
VRSHGGPTTDIAALATPSDIDAAILAAANLAVSPGLGHTAASYHAFGLIGTALSKKIGVFLSSSLKMVPISPNASYYRSSAL